MKSSNSGGTIAVLGDIIPADSPLMCGQGVLSKSGGDWGAVFAGLREYAADKDFLIGNFEAVLVPEVKRITPGEAAMKSPAAVVEFLKECKFKFLSIANNHTMEYGPDAFRWMTERFAKEGVTTFGHREEPCVFADWNGRRIGLLAFSGVPALYGHEPLYYYLPCGDADAEARLLEKIGDCRSRCDFLLVMPHWGNEFMTEPSAWQIELAGRMLSAGADAIAGMHPHVVQTGCEVGGKTVFFSIGNLLSDYFQPEIRENLAVKIGADAKGGLELRGEYFSCDDAFRIFAEGREFAVSEGLPERPDGEEYRKRANLARKKVRNQLIGYLAKHFSVWMFNAGFLSWIIRRACFLFVNRRKIRQNPNNVYNGPIH